MIYKVADNTFRIEIPLPHELLRSVNSYVFKGPGRNLIVDTGMMLDMCMEAMDIGLRELDLDLRNTDFFITHFHGDHFDLASWLARYGSTVFMSRIDAQFLEAIRESGSILLSHEEEFCALSGFPEATLRDAFQAIARYRRGDAKLPPFEYVEDGDIMEVGDYRFRCTATPGHSEGHVCLYDENEKIFVSGDHLLGGITPTIQGRFDQANPLGDYLESLDRVYQLEVNLVLPGHGDVFRNCRGRIDELRGHHEKRASEILALLEKGRDNVFNLASRMGWSIEGALWNDFPSFQKFLAVGETISHLKYLEETGLVTKETKGIELVYSLPPSQRGA
jgi:glyoxylase-like metal-dependent hydrolase (beta-lactamase superfamily II)